MKIRQNRQKSYFCYLEKGALKLYRAATTKPRQIEHSVFYSTGPQRTNSSLQTGLRSNGGLVPEKSLFPIEDDNYAPQDN